MLDENTIPRQTSGSPDDPIVNQLERILVGAVGLTTQALSVADPGFELTFPQWRALLVVGEDTDGARIGEVANRVGVTIPATSRLLRRLERRGLMVLGDDDLDRRATRARLTEHGKGVRETIVAHRRAVLRDLVREIPSDERMTLQTSLRTIARGLERFS